MSYICYIRAFIVPLNSLDFAEEVSDRLIFIGNLPAETEDEQVESLFSDARYVFVVRDSPNENAERKCSG